MNDVAHVGWVGELKADDGRTVSKKKRCLSLSSCRKPKLKEGNKSFVPETKESRQCFAYFMIPYVYFTYSYLCRILNTLQYHMNFISIIIDFIIILWDFNIHTDHLNSAWRRNLRGLFKKSSKLPESRCRAEHFYCDKTLPFLKKTRNKKW